VHPWTKVSARNRKRKRERERERERERGQRERERAETIIFGGNFVQERSGSRQQQLQLFSEFAFKHKMQFFGFGCDIINSNFSL
jgi:hypothetical protein